MASPPDPHAAYPHVNRELPPLAQRLNDQRFMYTMGCPYANISVSYKRRFKYFKLNVSSTRIYTPRSQIMNSLSPFSGLSRKLVIAFDVGTTYSGIGYAILDPGHVPKIQGVTRYIIPPSKAELFLTPSHSRFPGQENGDSKIPSTLWYTEDGKIRAAGAEARDPGMTLMAEDENLILVEWWA